MSLFCGIGMGDEGAPRGVNDRPPYGKVGASLFCGIGMGDEGAPRGKGVKNKKYGTAGGSAPFFRAMPVG